MRAKFVGILALIILLSGCATTTRETVQVQTPINYQKLSPYNEVGTATIKGQAFLRQKGGGVVTCAGSPVGLIPATPFFRQAMEIFKQGKDPQFAQQIEPAFRSVLKQTTGDAQGNFMFSNIPAGNWFITTDVVWTVGHLRQGGSLLREIKVGNGETQVILSDTDLVRR